MIIKFNHDELREILVRHCYTNLVNNDRYLVENIRISQDGELPVIEVFILDKEIDND